MQIGFVAIYAGVVEYASGPLSLAEAFAELPDDGCQCFTIFSDRFSVAGNQRIRSYLSGQDFYFYWPTSGEIHMSERGDTLADVERRYPDAVIVRGQWTSEDDVGLCVARSLEVEGWGA